MYFRSPPCQVCKVELLCIDLEGDLDVPICEENFGPNSEGTGVIRYENPL